MKRIGVGLIGVGKHGQRYVRHLAEVEELELVAISRRNHAAGAEQARSLRCDYHDTPEALICDRKVQAVVLVVPPTVNPELALAVARERKPLLVEKPLAATVAEGRRMVQAFDQAGAPCMVAHTLRFNRVVRTIKKSLEEIGPLHAACLSQRFEPSLLNWLDCPEVAGSGIIIHTGVHSFDLVRYFTGAEPRSVLAWHQRVVTRETEDNFAAIVLLEPGGIVATIAGSRATEGRSGYIELAGRSGQLVGDHVHGHASLLVGQHSHRLDPGEPAQTVKEVLEAFAVCLKTGSVPPITLRDGLAAVATAQACYRSVRSGKVEPVEGLC